MVANRLGMNYVEASARDGTNVQRVFLTIGKLIIDGQGTKLKRK